MNVISIIAQTDGWARIVAEWHPEQRAFLVIFVVGCSVAAVLGLAGIALSTIGKIHRARIEIDLKREMIERGMSADEIAKIIGVAAPAQGFIRGEAGLWTKCRKH